MKVLSAPLEGLLLIESKVRIDSRGFFLEVYRADQLAALGVQDSMVQVNRSFSHQNVLRGLHFQNPTPQGKLVSASCGSIFDVAVDLRPESPTFGRWFGEILTGDNGRHLWIPVGFAHGFAALTDAVVTYHVTAEFDPLGDASVRWDDPEIGITWPIQNPVLSEKDNLAPLLADLPPEKLFYSEEFS